MVYRVRFVSICIGEIIVLDILMIKHCMRICVNSDVDSTYYVCGVKINIYKKLIKTEMVKIQNVKRNKMMYVVMVLIS